MHQDMKRIGPKSKLNHQTEASKGQEKAVLNMPPAQAKIMQMQRLYGNRATTQLVRSQAAQFQQGDAPIQREEDPLEKQKIKQHLHDEMSDKLTQLAQNYYWFSYRMRGQATVDAYVNQKIDNLIATYGTKNLQLIEMQIEKDLNELGEMQGELLGVIEETLTALPEEMNTSKNKELLKDALNPPSMENVFAEESITKYAITFAKDQGRKLLANLKTVLKRVTDNWAQIKSEFGLEGDLKYVHLTGSDFHNQGQQVCILESTKGSKAVYKPRSVSPDQSLLDEKEGVFQGLNELSGDKLQLPTMKFIENQKEDYSFVEFQEHADVKDASTVHHHYYKMGQVTVASKLLGVNDLHQDNVMATTKGPNVIDAETSFLPYVMQAESYAKTGIQGALRSFTTTGEDLTNNYFVTKTEKETWESLTQEERKERKFFNYGQFVRDRRRNDLSGESNFLAAFEWGVQDALNVVRSKQQEIIKLILSKVQNVKHIRVVPLATQDFTQQIKDFQDQLRYSNKEDRDLIVGVKDQVVRSLQEKGFELAGNIDDVLVEGMLSDFQIRDTPIFHFEPSPNQLTYHERVVGIHPEWNDPEALVTRAVNGVVNTDVSKMKKELGLGPASV